MDLITKESSALSEPLEQAYSFESDVVCLGEICKAPWILYRFDGRRLTCWLSRWYYARVLVTGALIGPGVTTLLLLGKLNSNPWYVWLLVGLVSCIGWLGFIGALLHRCQIVFDFTSKKILYLLRPSGEPAYELDFKEVDSIFVEKILRQKTRTSLMASRISEEMAKKIATVPCYALGLKTKQGKTIYLLESTDESVIHEIKQILNEQRVASTGR